MIKRILIGIDDADLAKNAVEAGLDLAKAIGADAEFLHAVPGFWGWTPFSSVYGARAEAALLEGAREDRLAVLENWVRRNGHDRAWAGERLIVALERASDALVQRAEQPGADLIVLGAHADTAIDFGGTARGVLAASSCPVWVQKQPPTPIREILAPVSSLDDNTPSLSLARHLGKTLGARVTLLHSFVPPSFAYPIAAASSEEGQGEYVVEELRKSEREEFERQTAALAWDDVEWRALFEEGRPAERILAREDVDLICMGTHARSRLSKTVLGSEAYAVLKGATVPVVTSPIPD